MDLGDYFKPVLRRARYLGGQFRVAVNRLVHLGEVGDEMCDHSVLMSAAGCSLLLEVKRGLQIHNPPKLQGALHMNQYRVIATSKWKQFV